VFSCDSGLYIEGLEDARQPGIHVRNVNGKRLSDPEMVDYYSGIAKSLGGTCIARYKNAICLVINEDEIYECIEEDISGEKFGITGLPHPNSEEGFPIDRLSIHLESGKYYYDMEDLDLVSSMKDGFVSFFKKSLQL
jgi:8-oxo-dGTP diphosphatase